MNHTAGNGPDPRKRLERVAGDGEGQCGHVAYAAAGQFDEILPAQADGDVRGPASPFGDGTGTIGHRHRPGADIGPNQLELVPRRQVAGSIRPEAGRHRPHVVCYGGLGWGRLG